jgi:hypothetical protein
MSGNNDGQLAERDNAEEKKFAMDNPVICSDTAAHRSAHHHWDTCAGISRSGLYMMLRNEDNTEDVPACRKSCFEIKYS